MQQLPAAPLSFSSRLGAGSGALTGQVPHVPLQPPQDAVCLGGAEQQPVLAAQALPADLAAGGRRQHGHDPPAPVPVLVLVPAPVPVPLLLFLLQPRPLPARPRHRCPALRMRARARPEPRPLGSPRPLPRPRVRFWRQIAKFPQPTRISLLLLGGSAAAMIGQRTLLSFFGTAPARKRSRSPEPGGDEEVMGRGMRELGVHGALGGGVEAGVPGGCGAPGLRSRPHAALLPR